MRIIVALGRLGSQIDLDHTRVALHLFHTALGQDAPLVQDRHRPGQTADKLHVVFDHHDRMLTGQRNQQFGRSFGLLMGHTGHRLVHQQ